MTTSAPHQTHHASVEENYWANFYQKVQHTEPSTFAQFILSQPNTPNFVIDIGCGSGRDSFAFARNNRYVLGIDRSNEGILHATQFAHQENLSPFLEFKTVDIANTEQLKSALKHIKSKAKNTPVMFYMRFFLQSITAPAQENLLKAIAEIATKNDILAVEFRTDKDETNEKVHGGHYRRYQNAQLFSDSLKNSYDFEIIFETEEAGLSPYKGEDPILYRAIAKYTPSLN